ncbi:MAG: PAS domain S-box protein [Thermoanaerobaculia bacterium]
MARSSETDASSTEGQSPDGLRAPRAQQSLSLLEATLESTADGILVVGLNGRIVSYNQRFAEMWRIPREVLETRDDDQALAFVVGQLADPVSFLGKVRELYATPDAESFDVFTFRDGRVFERLSRPQILQGLSVGRVWSFRDVTERKRSERVQDATYRISEAVHEAQSIDELFRALHAIVSELMPARNFYIALYDREQGSLSFPYFVDECDSAPAPRPLGHGLTEFVLRNGRPLLASPEVFDTLVCKGEVELVGAPSVDWLGVPLRTARETIGVVVVQSYTEGVRFRESDRDLLAFVSTQLAMAVERKTAAEALRASERRYRLLFERIPAGVYRISLDGQILDCNDAYLKIFGFASREEALAIKTPSLYVDPQDRRRLIDRLLSEKAVTDVELKVRKTSGELIWVLASEMLLPGINGTDSILEGTLIDITERKRAAEALRHSRETMKELLDANPDPTLLTDRNGAILACNRVMAARLGKSFSEIIGSPVLDLLPPGTARVRGLRMEEAVRTRKTVRFRDERAGHTFDNTFVPIPDRTGSVTQLAIFGRDVTDLVRAEAELAKSELYYRSLIENAVDITAVLSPGGLVRYASPSTERVLGYPAEERVGRNIFELIHPEDRPEAERWFRRSFEGESHLRYFELRFQHRDGSWRTLSAIGNALPPETGVRGLILNARDITDRQQLEGKLRQAQKMEAVGRLAGGVAHDFNNLLTVIQGYGELLSASLSEDPARQEQMAEIVKAADRAATLTRQLLAFSRRQALEIRLFDLGTVVSETEKMLRRLIGEDIELVVGTPGEPALVKADPGQIEQVLMNLAVNSRDAMPAGGRLNVQVSEVHLGEALAASPEPVPAGRYVVLMVGDDGMGMDAETLAHVFEPFFTTKEKGKGTGLGMATVYGIVKQSGGYIAAASATGEGATFWIYLPRAEGDAAPKQEAVAIGTGGAETILLVEDEQAVRELTCRLLEGRGYRVLSAESGSEALVRLEQYEEPVHLLLTDIVMPGMSGRELAGHLMSRRPGTRVLFMSGYSSDPFSCEAPRERGVRFLQKPFTEAALAQAIREALDTSALDFGNLTPGI